MPVITCPDCGHDVSTLATACPHCGRPSPAGATPIAEGAVPPVREETLWTGTPSRVLLVGHVAGIVFVAVVVPLLVNWFASVGNDDLRFYGWVATAIIVAIQLIAFLVAWIRLRSTLYTVTNQRVIVEQGVFAKSVGEIDLRYVDDSNFRQSVAARLLRIGDVTLISSDKTTPQFVLRSVGDPRRIREMIRTAAYQASQRQLFTRAT